MAVAPATKAVTKPAPKASGKSGLRQLAPASVLFNDGEAADSLFIIQKGQIRLYKPKGKGFIELAVLRAGEVIGEMAFFDEDGSGKKRSCAAMAITNTEVIEISFAAFAKTMESLNPWFKTIINTLVTRLRKTNSRVKELESNAGTLNYGTKKGYEFLKPMDIIKVVSTIYLVLKGHGEKNDTGLSVHRNTMDLYVGDIYTLTESKVETILQVLIDMGLIVVSNDKDNLPKILTAKNVETLKNLLVFLNTQRHLDEAKKIKISEKCQSFLEKIFTAISVGQVQTDKFVCDLQPILEDFKSRNIPITHLDLEDSMTVGITSEVNINKLNQVSTEVNVMKLKQLLPMIRFINRLEKENRAREGS